MYKKKCKECNRHCKTFCGLTLDYIEQEQIKINIDWAVVGCYVASMIICLALIAAVLP